MGASSVARSDTDRRTGTRRVVIESRDAASAAATAALLGVRGFDTVVCAGPGGANGCPLVAEGHCTLIEDADLAYFDLDLDDPGERAVLEHMRVRYPSMPVVVEVPTSVARRYDTLLAGCRVVTPYSPEHLEQAIEDALDETP